MKTDYFHNPEHESVVYVTEFDDGYVAITTVTRQFDGVSRSGVALSRESVQGLKYILTNQKGKK